MKPIAAITLIIVPAITLAACGPADNDPGPGGVTVGEARALDDAAQMLDARRPPPADADADGASAAPVNTDTAETGGPAE